VDFAIPYTDEQERFRVEVRAWLVENAPDSMRIPVDPNDVTEEMHSYWLEKHLELGKKGWLYPTYPQEYGGGGLTSDHETILDEEFDRARAPRQYGNTYCFGSLMVWGTEQQKQKFLVPFMKGEKRNHQRLTEPQGGADLANVQGRAVRDGDDWLLTGQNVFISCWGDEDYLPGVMMTDSEAPRHRNLGFFMIPTNAPGLEMRAMDLLPSSGRVPGPGQKAVFMDSVRVPADHLIGGDHQGWQVMQTLLEVEHGARGKAFTRDEDVDNLVRYVTDTKYDGGTVGSDPVRQQKTMDAVIEAHVQSLFQRHTFWMYQNHMEMQGESNITNVHGRESDCRNGIRFREVMGMYAFLNTTEPGAPQGGRQEVYQRSIAGQRHAGGSTNIAKVILARRIGISRTQERAAPTPSTATSQGG
jgi:alkylation response protein AidB-like acyl-CoA dehydrogenase